VERVAPLFAEKQIVKALPLDVEGGSAGFDRPAQRPISG
jgi:hypothetical protein